MLTNVTSWGRGEGYWASSICLLLFLPRRPARACSVSRHWQECVFPWQKCNCSIHKKIVHSVLVPQTLEMSRMLVIQACLPVSAMPGSCTPPLRATAWAGALSRSAAPTAATPSVLKLVSVLHLWGNSWSHIVEIQIAQALALYHPLSWAVASGSVSLKCRAIKLLFYLAWMQFSGVI